MCVGGLSKHITSAVTESGSLGPIPISRCAVAFHPFSVAKGLSDLIISEPLLTKLPFSAGSSASHKAMEEYSLVSRYQQQYFLQQYRHWWYLLCQDLMDLVFHQDLLDPVYLEFLAVLLDQLGPGGPCVIVLLSLISFLSSLSSNLFNLQNSTELTKKPSKGPVLHSYFLSYV